MSDSLMAEWRNGQPWWDAAHLGRHRPTSVTPALPLALALSFAPGQAGAAPLALLQRRGELGHPVQCRPLLGRDGR